MAVSMAVTKVTLTAVWTAFEMVGWRVGSMAASTAEKEVGWRT